MTALLPLLAALACTPEPTSTPPPPALESTPEHPPGSRVEPAVRWASFFVERFGAPPDSRWQLDLDGDGQPELLVIIGTALLRFHDLDAPLPSDWETYPVPTESGWGQGPTERLPDIPPGAQALTHGGRAPLFLYWSTTLQDLVWYQPLPSAWADLAAQYPPLPPQHRRLQSQDCPPLLTDHFLGDFNADEAMELVVVSRQGPDASVVIRHWLAPDAPPTTTTIDYPACRVWLVPNHQRPFIDATGQSWTLDGDLLQLEIPETASVLLDESGGQWVLRRPGG